MPSKKVQRVVSPRKLTADEAAEARRLRELVEKDKDEILDEGRRILAAKRRATQHQRAPRRSARRSEPRARPAE